LEEKIAGIAAAISALLNSCCGGQLQLNFDDNCCEMIATEPKKIDDMVRRIEQSVVKFAGVATVSDALKLLDTNPHCLQFNVKPAGRLCTVDYHLFLPTNYQVSAISNMEDSSAKVAALLQARCEMTAVSFPQHCTGFYYKKRAPDGLREGQMVQFKHLKDDQMSTSTQKSNVTLADRMIKKSNKLVIYISAFANHEGGHIYFGVDDTTYTVQGQVASESERAKIEKKVSSIISKMVWPVESPDRFWKLHFVPVLEKLGVGNVARRDTYVIVVSVAKCPGGVFVEEPESYHLVNEMVTRMPFPFWREKLVADNNRCSMKLRFHNNMACRSCRSTIAPSVAPTGWSSTKREDEYMKITQLMENLRNNGNWSGIDQIEKKVLTSSKTNTDLKLAVTFQCTAAKYRQNRFKEAYEFLECYQSLIKLAENQAIFEVQGLYSWSAIKRSERDYQESYKYTYDALQMMQLIVPGWITAWFLCNAASLLTMFASEEEDTTSKETLIGEAECYYRQALEHSQSITMYKKAAANLRHRVHINLAMLYLASSPKFDIVNYRQIISPDSLKSAQESLWAAKDSEGPPMTGFNKFYFILAKSDLCLRFYQQKPDENVHCLQKATRYANKAHDVATDNEFAEVLHYAQSRIELFQKMPQQGENTVDQILDVLLFE
jgi:tetratricopeptide (TPR) repeat protein